VRRLVPVMFRLAVGGVFVLAGTLKALDTAAFANDVARYGLAPEVAVNLVAILLPWVELVAGAALVSGIWVDAAAGLIASLNGLFVVAVSVALARGLEVCGCFGGSVARKASGWTLVVDVGLLVVSIWLIFYERRKLRR